MREKKAWKSGGGAKDKKPWKWFKLLQFLEKAFENCETDSNYKDDASASATYVLTIPDGGNEEMLKSPLVEDTSCSMTLGPVCLILEETDTNQNVNSIVTAEVEVPVEMPQSSKRANSPVSNRKKSDKKVKGGGNQETDYLDRSIIEYLNTKKEDDTLETCFGRTVAKKLSEMDTAARDFAMFKIHELLYNISSGHLQP